ncbi:MAG: DUF669 domain-containing protein [Legionellales bacterium]|nr:DUF669 domain-containing protein [Legionellales bacterium]
MDLSSLLKNTKPQEDQVEKKALPQGSYNVVIEKVEAKTSAAGNKGISLQMRVFGAQYNNYVVFDYMAISGSEKALEYSLPKLKKLGVLLGSEDATKWQGGKVRVNLSVDKKDDTKNINWGFSQVSEDDNTPISNNTTPTITADDLPF